MLRKDHNDLLTQTGPGTPMGRLFRSYWIPALLPEELPENDCPPVRVKLLSERLIAFRDTDGRYGLMDEFCAHRGVSLWFGRNEECGLRCPYHGWKYDVTGQCIDMPSEPEQSRLRTQGEAEVLSARRARRRALDLHGPADAAAAAARMGIRHGAGGAVVHVEALQECNWLQAMEGGIDSSHVSFLHRGDLNSDPLFKGARGNQYNLGDSRPVFEVVESPGGLYIGARRNAENGHYYWRITQWVMPSFTMIAPRGNHAVHGHFWIPIDDENCWTWSFDYHPTRALTERKWTPCAPARASTSSTCPGTFRPLANKDNDYLIDRAAQKAGRTYSGVEGFAMQDASLQESMGPIVDRTKETPRLDRQRHHHGAAAAAARGQGARGQRRDAARAWIRSTRECVRLRSILPPDQPFKDGAREALIARPACCAVLGLIGDRTQGPASAGPRSPAVPLMRAG